MAARGWPLADADLWQASVTSHLGKTSSVGSGQRDTPHRRTSLPKPPAHATVAPIKALMDVLVLCHADDSTLIYGAARGWRSEERGGLMVKEAGKSYRLGGGSGSLIMGRHCNVRGFFFFLFLHHPSLPPTLPPSSFHTPRTQRGGLGWGISPESLISPRWHGSHPGCHFASPMPREAECGRADRAGGRWGPKMLETHLAQSQTTSPQPPANPPFSIFHDTCVCLCELLYFVIFLTFMIRPDFCLRHPACLLAAHQDFFFYGSMSVILIRFLF